MKLMKEFRQQLSAMKSLKSLLRRIGSEALANFPFSFLSSLSPFLGVSKGMFHLARASTHQERTEYSDKALETANDALKPKKVYKVICLSKFGATMSIHVPEETSIGAIFHDTAAKQLVVFKDEP